MLSGRGERVELRAELRKYFGDHCYWCGLTMGFPEEREPCTDLPNMATIEHHLQKSKGPHKIHLRLVHKRCNI